MTVASISLRITIGGLEVAFYVAERANNIRKAAMSDADSISRHTGSKEKDNGDGTRSVLDKGFAVVGKATRVAKPFVKLAMKSTLKLIRFIVVVLRNAFVALEGAFLVIDIVIFVVILVASAGYIALFCKTDENGNLIINDELVLESYNSNGTSSNDGESSTETIFEKYNLSNDEIEKLARLCYKEQASEAGAAAEASLMCNLFESSRGNGYDSVYDYVRNSGWFANASKHMDTGTCPDNIVTIVANVIKKGIRTLPGYIDEHDCLSDITSATNNNGAITVSDKSKYKKHETQITNRYGANYTFYCFPDDISDPFGYTSEDVRKDKGETFYSLEEAKAGKLNGKTRGGGKFLLQCDNPDPSYKGQPWEVEDRDLLELCVTREYGADYEGSVLVAQTIRDIMMKENTHKFADVYHKYSFDTKLPSEPLQKAKDAVKFVFDEGNSGVQHKMMCFYASDGMYSKWHEAQNFVIQHINVRFFDFD